MTSEEYKEWVASLTQAEIDHALDEYHQNPHVWETIRWIRGSGHPFVQRCVVCGEHRRFHRGRWVPSGPPAKNPCGAELAHNPLLFGWVADDPQCRRLRRV